MSMKLNLKLTRKNKALVFLAGTWFSSQAFAFNEVKDLIESCTPRSHWDVMEKIVKVESNGHKYAIGVNAKGYKSRFPDNKGDAETVLESLLAEGVNVDIGLAQINSQHFKRNGVFAKRGFAAKDALDPCTNLKMGAYILSENFRRYGNVPDALSAYNTGSGKKGYHNGYVEKYID